MLACSLGMASCAADNADVTIKFPAGAPQKVVVSHSLVSDMLNARRQADMKIVTDTVDVVDGVATLKLDDRGAARYLVEVSPEVAADFYAAPGETINVAIPSMQPLDYSVSGTPLMEGMTELQTATAPIEAEYMALGASAQQPTEEQVRAIMQKYDDAVKNFIKSNPESPAVAYAMMNLSGEPFMEVYETMSPKAKESILYPFVERQAERAKEQIQMEQRRKALASGSMEAPAFTFKNLEGKDVSLSDFRGKWVVIDFWGSWCGWCIKGIPALKEAYKEYAGKLEVIGVDCRDTEEAWRAAVAKYELPWVNVYNNQTDGKILEAYTVEGFPTKAIVNPEGKLVDVTVGEDPAFFTKLANFINGK